MQVHYDASLSVWPALFKPYLTSFFGGSIFRLLLFRHRLCLTAKALDSYSSFLVSYVTVKLQVDLLSDALLCWRYSYHHYWMVWWKLCSSFFVNESKSFDR